MQILDKIEKKVDDLNTRVHRLENTFVESNSKCDHLTRKIDERYTHRLNLMDANFEIEFKKIEVSI